MPDLPSVLDSADFINTPAWKGILWAFRQGTPPHSWAVKAPLFLHAPLLTEMSKLYLCDALSDAGPGAGCNCKGCRGWIREGENPFGAHPDRIIAGEFEKAGSVDVCREMLRELSLRPAASKRRLGVVLSADRLLIHAANTLLKTAEEPPSHACLLFLMEGNDFLPTLRSRSRFTAFAAPPQPEACFMPAKEAEWVEWLENLKDGEDMPALLSAWVSSLLREGRPELAARAEGLRLLALQKKLSQTMVCDLLILTLKEGLPFEPVPGGFW